MHYCSAVNNAIKYVMEDSMMRATEDNRAEDVDLLTSVCRLVYTI